MRLFGDKRQWEIWKALAPLIFDTFVKEVMNVL